MLNIEKHANDIVKEGFTTITMPPGMLRYVDRIVTEYDRIDAEIKKTFSFQSKDDGFLSFGHEYSESPDRLDLCERFCYWLANSAAHQESSFVHSEFYQAVISYEKLCDEIGQRIMNAICAQYGKKPLPSGRESSYVQLCVYSETYWKPDRKFMQDPHEDGHFLTMLKPTSDGLAFIFGDEIRPIELAADKMIIFSGSLLTELTDGEISATRHAALTPKVPTMRKSLMYFVNPNMDQPIESLTKRRPIDFRHLANERHISFGNPPLIQPESNELKEMSGKASNQ